METFEHYKSSKHQFSMFWTKSGKGRSTTWAKLLLLRFHSFIAAFYCLKSHHWYSATFSVFRSFRRWKLFRKTVLHCAQNFSKIIELCRQKMTTAFIVFLTLVYWTNCFPWSCKVQWNYRSLNVIMFHVQCQHWTWNSTYYYR